jgi:primosomal protein N' (replication factor Y)
VRVASVTAAPASVTRAIGAARDAAGDVDALGPTAVEEGLDRAIVRFDYAAGAAVAKALRAEMIRVATERRRPVAGRPPKRPAVLRVRFDDPEVP